MPYWRWSSCHCIVAGQQHVVFARTVNLCITAELSIFSSSQKSKFSALILLFSTVSDPAVDRRQQWKCGEKYCAVHNCNCAPVVLSIAHQHQVRGQSQRISYETLDLERSRRWSERFDSLRPIDSRDEVLCMLVDA